MKEKKSLWKNVFYTYSIWVCGTPKRLRWTKQNTRRLSLYHVGDVLFHLVTSVSVCQLHRPHSHGYPAEPGAAGHSVRHLRVHHEEIPVLPIEPESLAELHQTQPVSQQLLHQGKGAQGKLGSQFNTVVQVFLCLRKGIWQTTFLILHDFNH